FAYPAFAELPGRAPAPARTGRLPRNDQTPPASPARPCRRGPCRLDPGEGRVRAAAGSRDRNTRTPRPGTAAPPVIGGGPEPDPGRQTFGQRVQPRQTRPLPRTPPNPGRTRRIRTLTQPGSRDLWATFRWVSEGILPKWH